SYHESIPGLVSLAGGAIDGGEQVVRNSDGGLSKRHMVLQSVVTMSIPRLRGSARCRLRVPDGCLSSESAARRMTPSTSTPDRSAAGCVTPYNRDSRSCWLTRREFPFGQTSRFDPRAGPEGRNAPVS